MAAAGRGLARGLLASVFAAGLGGASLAAPATAATPSDWITGLPRQELPVASWPGGKKVAICFVLDAEDWGHGHGPNFRSDMAGRDPDIVDEAFRQYAINFGLTRVAEVFKDEGVPLSFVLNAVFPAKHPEVWARLHSLAPNAPIIAHGMNNSTQQLPLGKGPDVQAAYIRKTIDLIAKDTGVRPTGWSSPSVYPDADTFSASTAAGITYSFDGMDSDYLSVLKTKSGPLVLIPYPVITVDMGNYLSRNKEPEDMARLWIDYASELEREANSNPSAPATVLAIGIHPFVVGTPSGAAALRRTLETLKTLKLVWLTDPTAVLTAAGWPRP